MTKTMRMKSKMLLIAAIAAIAATSFLGANPAQAAHARIVVEKGINSARIQALHECTDIERRYPQNTYGMNEILIYSACMASHGQVE